MIQKNKPHGCMMPISNPFHYLEGILAHQVLMLRASQLEVIDYCWNLQAASSSDTRVPQSTAWIPTNVICSADSENLNCNRPHRPHILHHPDKFLSHESFYGLAFAACSGLCFPQRHSHTLPLTHQQIPPLSPPFLRVSEWSMLKSLHLHLSHFACHTWETVPHP